MPAEAFLDKNESKAGAAFAVHLAETQAQETASNGFVAEFLESAAYSAVQTPILGISQIVDRTFLTNISPKLTFMDAPKEASDVTDWHAQQIGGAVGMIPSFVLLHKGVNKGMSKVLGPVPLGQTMSFSRAVSSAALTGAIYEGVLLPSAPPKNNQDSFNVIQRVLDLGADRLPNAARGGLTFATLAAGARGLHDTGLIRNKLAIGVVSGIPAGIVSAQADSLLHGKGFASARDSIKGAYTFAMVGGVLTAAHQFPMGELAKNSKGTEVAQEPGAAAERAVGKENVAPAADVAVEPGQNAGKAGPAAAVEFTVDAAGAARLKAFQVGETPTAWAEIQKAGEPRRTLFVQHGEKPAGPVADGKAAGQPVDGQSPGQPGDGKAVSQPGDGKAVSQPGDGKAVGQPGDGKSVSQPGDGLPFDGSRSDLVAMCYMPEALARHLGLPNAANRPLFMDMPGNDRVRISPERLSPEAIELAKEGKTPREVKAANVKQIRQLLDEFSIEPDEVPPWLGDHKPTGQVWSGVDSVVIELQQRPGMPEVVLKVKRTALEGQRWYEADIYDAKGKVNPRAVHETTDGGGGELYMFLESKCDCYSAEPGLGALQQSLEAKGIAIEPGSGPPFGFDLNTKKWVVVDRDGSAKRGQGAQDPENSGKSGEELDALRLLEDEAAGKDKWDDGYSEVDGVDQYRGREAVDAIKLNERERAAVEKAFGKENAVEKLQALMQQMMDGLSSRNDVQILQTIVVNGGSAAKTQAQMSIAAEIAVGMKLPNLNSWVKRYATGTQ